QDLCACILLSERRCGAMDRITLLEFHSTAIVNRVASDIKKPAKHAFAYWYGDWTASIGHAHMPLQIVGSRHCYRSHSTVTEMLMYLECQICRVAIAHVLEF